MKEEYSSRYENATTHVQCCGGKERKGSFFTSVFLKLEFDLFFYSSNLALHIIKLIYLSLFCFLLLLLLLLGSPILGSI